MLIDQFQDGEFVPTASRAVEVEKNVRVNKNE
jgi:hypothetical protein